MKKQVESYSVGTQLESWNGGTAQSLTFIVTEDCNLRCKYCYITHKASNKRMNFETAKKFIDYVLSGNLLLQESVTLDFIGGEPLLEARLIDKICDYFKYKTYILGLQWFWNYRISICTNGINYSDSFIQQFIEKNSGKISITITIDGIKEKHDLQRVFPDGSGSYDQVKKNVDIWKEQFAPSTKVTFASDDLKFLKESIINLWSQGILHIAANVVFEDVWNEHDDKLFEEQLKELADYILENKLFDKGYICTLFDDTIGYQYMEDQLLQTSCGAGKMLALGTDGKIYPCMRYCAYSLNQKREYVIGDVEKGINFEKVRPFETVTYKMQSDKECIECPVATGCSFCQGFNYDMADTETNFQRAKYICKMHKARVRANNYYFAKLYNIYGIPKNENNGCNKKTLNFVLSGNFIQCCPGPQFKNSSNDSMSELTMLDGLKYAEKNFLRPVFIHDENMLSIIKIKKLEEYNILHIVSANQYPEAREIYKDVLPVFDQNTVYDVSFNINNCILNIDSRDLLNMGNYVEKLWDKVDRININILGIISEELLETYKKELKKISNFIIDTLNSEGRLKEVNLLTDILFMKKHGNCEAGHNSITYAPNGKFYICPEFYSKDQGDSIGDINGINIPNKQLYTQDYSPICQKCDANHCVDCVCYNKLYTSEINVPPRIICLKSHVEREVSLEMQKRMVGVNLLHPLNAIDYKDPLDLLRSEINNYKIGFYPKTEC